MEEIFLDWRKLWRKKLVMPKKTKFSSDGLEINVITTQAERSNGRNVKENDLVIWVRTSVMKGFDKFNYYVISFSGHELFLTCNSKSLVQIPVRYLYCVIDGGC